MAADRVLTAATTASPPPPRSPIRKKGVSDVSDGEEDWVDCLESPTNSPKRPSSNKSKNNGEEAEGKKERKEDGIALNGMLGSIFGVDFLPFHEDFHGDQDVANQRKLRTQVTASTLATSGTTVGSDGSGGVESAPPLTRSRGQGEDKDEVDSTYHSCIHQVPTEDEEHEDTHISAQALSSEATPPPAPLAGTVTPAASPAKKKGIFRKKKKTSNVSDAASSITDEISDHNERKMIITELPPPTPSGSNNNENDSMKTLESVTPTVVNKKKKKNVFKRAVRTMKKRNKKNSSIPGNSDDGYSTSSAPVTSLSGSFNATDMGGIPTVAATIKIPSASLPPEQKVEETLRLIRSDFLQMEAHKAHISKLQTQAEEASSRASKINKNISTLSSTLQELHTKLKILEDNLMSEQAALTGVNQEMDYLEVERKKHEEEMKRLKDVVDGRKDHMSNLLSKANIGDEGKRESAPSFLTAYESEQQLQQQQTLHTAMSYPSTISSCDSIKEEDEYDIMPSPLLSKGLSVDEDEEDQELLLHQNEEQDGLTSTPTVYRKSLTCPPAIQDEEVLAEQQQKKKKALLQEKIHSSFMRTHDLEFAPVSSARSSYSDGVESFLSLSSTNSLDEGEGEAQQPSRNEKRDIMQLNEKAPILLDALAKMGYECATDEGPRWTPTSDTKKIISKRNGKQCQSELAMTWSKYPWHQPQDKKEIFLWSGKFDHGGHGCDLPVIKTRGIIHTTAKSLVELIVDSGRVKEYNTMALGRTDEFFFQEGLDTHPSESILGIGGEAKLIRSLSKPPLIKKPLEFFNVMHARKLSEVKGEKVKGYVCVTRSVWENEEFADSMSSKSSKKNTTISSNTTRSELLLGVNIMRDLEGEHEGWCELTTISHLNSPGVPLSLGKRIGLSAASNNIRSLQAIWE